MNTTFFVAAGLFGVLFFLVYWLFFRRLRLLPGVIWMAAMSIVMAGVVAGMTALIPLNVNAVLGNPVGAVLGLVLARWLVGYQRQRAGKAASDAVDQE